VGDLRAMISGARSLCKASHCAGPPGLFVSLDSVPTVEQQRFKETMHKQRMTVCTG
jgi:hypothetical protein